MILVPARRVGGGFFESITRSSRVKTIRPSFVNHLEHRPAPVRAFSNNSIRYQTEPIQTARNSNHQPPAASKSNSPSPNELGRRSLTDGLDDPPPVLSPDEKQVDWTRSFHGLSKEPFSKEATDALLERIDPEDIEIKPDGIIYLPEIKYRRILNRAFGPGGWGLAPRGETIVTGKLVTREYGLVANGR